MIYFLIATIIIILLAFYDDTPFIHFGLYAATILMVMFIITGCSSIPPSPYDNEPFIWID